MIILDTHIWIWWVSQHPQLTARHQQIIRDHQASGLGVSMISCWEAAKLVENDKLQLSLPIEDWIPQALAYSGIQLLELTIPIIVDSTQLPGSFHRDPADQMIVATARIYQSPLLTVDSKILNYPYVQVIH